MKSRRALKIALSATALSIGACGLPLLRKANTRHPIAAAALLAALCAPLQGADFVSGRRITAIGCHHGDGTCYVTLDGAAFGASEGCAQGASNQFRWDTADTPSGRRTYASMLAAYLQQKRLDVAIAGCSAQGVPTLSYYFVHD